MSTTPTAIQNLARQLLAGDPALVESSNDGDADRAVRACEKLRVPLTRLAGVMGFSSLLSRALALATRQAPSLKNLRVEADGSLVKVDEIRRELDAEEARRGSVVLVVELLRLLIMLIGEPLTLSLVREAWPDASLETTILRMEETP